MRSEKGYTVIEMMVVLVVVGIASTIAIVDHSAKLPHNNLRKASRNIVSKLRLIRQRAITTSANTSATFIVNHNFYFFKDVGEYQLPRYIRFGLPEEVKDKPNGKPIPTSARDGSSFTNEKVSFEPDGTMSGAVTGRIYLTNASNSSSGDELFREAFAIEVNRTGQVKLLKWNETQWE